MKLYTSTGAPNPRRVHMFIAEKGIDVPTETVSLREGAHFSDAFTAVNPEHVVPALALDDGSVITESLAICRYLEALHPKPALFGETPDEQGRVEMWLRKIEIQGYLPTQDAYRNGHPAFEGRGLPGRRGDTPQIPELVTRSNDVMGRLLDRLDTQLGKHAWVVGEKYSAADIVLLSTLDFGKRTRFDVVQDLSKWPNVAAWHERASDRPSAAVNPS